MSKAKIERLKEVKDFHGLIVYLKDELGWPIEEEKVEDLTFEYNSKELGIEEKYSANINIIKQIRPLVDNQPWGLFYVEFESKHLPVVVLRRILRGLIHNRRKASDHMKTWGLSDLIFISTLGEDSERKISFAHFSESKEGLPVLRTFSWDPTDTYFHYLQTRLDLDKLRWPEDENDIQSWRERWSFAFKLKHREVIRTSKQLASVMAHLAKQIREQVKNVYKFEIMDGPLHKLFLNFKNILIHDLKIDNFADMYAQTISYGLFSARASHEGEFKIDNISAMIPNTNPFLKNLFEECTKIGEDNIDKIDLDELGVRELILLLKESNIEAVLQDFGKQKKKEDPVIHFYELFLNEYDTTQKIKRGVFYTPDPVVSFIVRSVDKIIQNEFGYAYGLMDITKSLKNNNYKIKILDPAVGTGTFLQHTIREIKKKFDYKYKKLNNKELVEKWNEFVPNHLFPKLFGFEIMMAPYSVAHLKLGLTLKETGYKFKSNRRLGIYLTNTLEGTHKGAGTLDTHLNWLTAEVDKANEVKMGGISIIMGNPPYSKITQNKNAWILNLINSYRYIDGEPIKEKKIWIQDDYIKFIRFGQWLLSRQSKGILAYISNSGFLDNPTLRGMRQSLINEFNYIYVLNLHGDSKRHENVPDGLGNDNVFDIQQGVCITFFVKNKKINENKIYYYDLWGNRKLKYSFLDSNTIKSISYKEIKPISPYYMFFPRDLRHLEEYNKYWSITEIFSKNISGIVTSQDKFIIDSDENNLLKKVKDFFDKKIPEKQLINTYKFGKNYKTKIKPARDAIALMHELKYYIKPLLYRPFDKRLIFYHPLTLWRTRTKKNDPNIIMSMILPSNLALVTTRNITSLDYNHISVTNHIIEMKMCSHDRNTYIFPLFYYNLSKVKNPFEVDITEGTEKVWNLNQKFCELIERKTGLKYTLNENRKEGCFIPKDVLFYILTILYSNSYRERYAEFLKPDFARIPIPNSKELFVEMAQLGVSISKYLLLDFELVDKNPYNFNYKGTNHLSRGYPKFKKNKIYINEMQFFEKIDQEVWEFKIGGYQVCKKWIQFIKKGTKNKEVTRQEIMLYQKILFGITQIINEMVKIDEIIEKKGGWPIN